MAKKPILPTLAVLPAGFSEKRRGCFVSLRIAKKKTTYQQAKLAEMPILPILAILPKPAKDENGSNPNRDDGYRKKGERRKKGGWS